MVSANSSPFTARETHGRAVRPENELLAHSEDVGWRSLHAAIFREAPLHVREPALDHPFIIYHITHPTEVSRKIEGARRERKGAPTSLRARRYVAAPMGARSGGGERSTPSVRSGDTRSGTAVPRRRRDDR